MRATLADPFVPEHRFEAYCLAVSVPEIVLRELRSTAKVYQHACQTVRSLMIIVHAMHTLSYQVTPLSFYRLIL